jgi:hypothetical protein
LDDLRKEMVQTVQDTRKTVADYATEMRKAAMHSSDPAKQVESEAVDL